MYVLLQTELVRYFYEEIEEVIKSRDGLVITKIENIRTDGN